MIAQQRRTEMLTNNLANASTPGYKADQSSLRAFPEMLISHLGEKDVPVKNGFTLPASNIVGQSSIFFFVFEDDLPKSSNTVKNSNTTTLLAKLVFNSHCYYLLKKNGHRHKKSRVPTSVSAQLCLVL